MKFPNAAKGIKKIFAAEILRLFGAICFIAAAIMIVIGFATAAVDAGDLSSVKNVTEIFAGPNGTAAATMLLIGGGIVCVGFILFIIGFIMNLVGYINASHDDSAFKSALIFLLISIVFAIVYGFTYNSGVGSAMYSFVTLTETIATIFVIAGVVKIADQLNRGDVSRKGSNILKLLIIVEVIAFIVSLITCFMGGMAASITAAILLLVALVLSFIKYIMYLTFLAKAKKMLAEGK